MVALDLSKHLGVELNKGLTVLVVQPGGQADRLAGEHGSLLAALPFPLTMGCRLAFVGDVPVASKEELETV